MNKKIKRDIGKFQATSEDGKIFTIIINQVFLIDEAFQQTPQEIPSIKSYTTIDGLTVNPKRNNQYEILQTGQILTRV
ncbi:MAG: hypothetical protein H8D87_06315 [Deltaproteobacteria bacterium]|uniref:hypothetical protein n=1 Tax=Desulfobacula sp. TaxID=2593537 RepID=UPI001992B5BF|nr:hypothetical protein [Candidatus Desulfobacula maris]MBL6994788.1 hypothetical protein [Desulfobacula sp.]